METISTYEQQAKDLLTKLGIEFKYEFIKNDYHSNDDKDKRDIYIITLKRGNRSISFEFGQSLVNSTKFVDNLNGNEFTTNGGTLKGNLRVNDARFLKDYCKLVKGTPPNEYDILACLQKYEVGTFEEFCDDFGCDTDSLKAEKIYKEVKEEYLKVCTIFSETEIEELQEIQ